MLKFVIFKRGRTMVEGSALFKSQSLCKNMIFLKMFSKCLEKFLVNGWHSSDYKLYNANGHLASLKINNNVIFIHFCSSYLLVVRPSNLPLSLETHFSMFVGNMFLSLLLTTKNHLYMALINESKWRLKCIVCPKNLC